MIVIYGRINSLTKDQHMFQIMEQLMQNMCTMHSLQYISTNFVLGACQLEYLIREPF